MSDIRIDQLTKQWGPVTAVDRISFSVPAGSLTVLLGPSGCGKSTILRLIAGLEAVTSGSISIGGRDATHTDPAQRGVSMVFQSYALFPHLNVRENILFGLKVRKAPREEQEKRLGEAAAMVGLESLLNRRPAQLSGGQRQRVALARSIVSRRNVCLMDEPLSNLDAKLRAEMRDEIRTLQKKLGLTMLYVTHDQIEAMTMADQVILLNDGRIEQVGRPRDLYDHPGTAFAARFMGSPPMNLLTLDPARATAAFVDKEDGGPNPRRGGDMILGIRPEHVRIGGDGIPGKVLAADYLGSEMVLRIDVSGQVLFARTDGQNAWRPGDPVKVSWHETHVCRFNENGRTFNIKEPTPQ